MVSRTDGEYSSTVLRSAARRYGVLYYRYLLRWTR
jgi:hypothetical protein